VPSIRFDDVRDRPVRRKRQRLQTSFNPIQVLGGPEAVCDATTRCYAICGGLDPFDVLGLPDFVPRFTRSISSYR
jgi:hypothetical protein